MDSLLLIIEKGNISLLSERGKLEQESIGKRMSEEFQTVFQKNRGSIIVSTTKKERTKQSAKAFIKGLNPDTSLHIQTNYNNNDELAFYDVSPAYREYKEIGSWRKVYENLQDQVNVRAFYSKVTQYFFTGTFLHKMNAKDPSIVLDAESFAKAYYDAASIVESLDIEIKEKGFSSADLDLKSLIPCEDLQKFNYVNCAEEFLLKGPALDADGIQVKIAAPLLLSFLESTEEYIQSSKVIAQLRFGHAETVAPFAAILGISGASESVAGNTVKSYQKGWLCENIIPLSANIQWILYKNKSTQDYIVKLMLNEKEVSINGLKDVGTPYYYSWESVRDFYNGKLDKVNLHFKDDIHAFLLRLK